MKLRLHILNLAVAAGLALCLCDVAAQAGPAEDAARLETLFAELQSADADGAARAEREIWRLWSHSGSAAMDLLLERGRKSMEQGDLETAIQHFSALTDHAPEFAEGWNARATAFFHAGRFGQSVADIQRTLALNPRHFGAMAGFGAILEQLDRKPQALEVYRAVLAIHPQMQSIRDAVTRLDRDLAGQQL
ncbi:MAG TPA: hypothetical protein DEF16_11620 [Gemmobacter sp.]|nr:hypothetical protein [Gemmobacter sp.]HBU15369.1 hypothetical protein [Gemmobacter sp.]